MKKWCWDIGNMIHKISVIMAIMIKVSIIPTLPLSQKYKSLKLQEAIERGQ